WLTGTTSGSSITLLNYDGTNAAAPGAYSSGGTVDGGDLGMADAAIQSQVVPDNGIALVSAATTASVALVCTAYIKANANLTATAAAAAISVAVSTYLGTTAIGGIKAEASGIVPRSEVLIQIANANPGTVSVSPMTLNGGTADVTLTASQV